MSGLAGIMTKRRPPGKRLWHGNRHGPMPATGDSDSPLTPSRLQADSVPARFRREKLTIATGIQIRFWFVLFVNDQPASVVGNFTGALWTESGGSCADSANHIS